MSFSSLFFETFSNYGRQLIFAVAPIPAYLPQYYTMCQSSNDPVLLAERRKFTPSPVMKKKKKKSLSGGSCHDFTVLVVDPCASTSVSSSSSSNKNPSSSISSSTTTTTAPPVVLYGRTHQITEAGFSSTSIMILLLSHTFRLQYFIGSAVLYNINMYHGDAELGAKVDKIHLDLVTQSLVMVGVQLLLLSAVTRRRRMANKAKVHDDDDDYHDNNDNDDYFDHNHPYKDHARSDHAASYYYLSSLLYYWKHIIGKRVICKSKKRETNKESSISQKPFVWMVHPRRYWKWDTVHQYVELIAVISVVMFAIGRYYLYPNDFLQYINTVKIVSVLLESCLALPQIILNYQRQSTEGLSLVMVLGWIVGDLLKMVYFIMSSGVFFPGHPHHHGGVIPIVVGEGGRRNNVEDSSSSDMSTFIVGCIFALIMDVIVGLQVCRYYPSRDMMNLMEKLRRLWRRFEIQVLQIDIGSTSSVVGSNHRNSFSGGGGGGCMDGVSGDSMTCL